MKKKRRKGVTIQEYWKLRETMIGKRLRSFKVAHMSNAKWRRLFLALDEKKELIHGYRWAFVGGEVYPSPEITRVLEPVDIEESTTADNCGIPAAMPYREIYYLVVVTEKVEELAGYLDTIGQFKLVPHAEGFAVLGYG